MSTAEVEIDGNDLDRPRGVEDIESIDDIEDVEDLDELADLDGDDALPDEDTLDDEDSLGDDVVSDVDIDEVVDIVAVGATGSVIKVAAAAERAAETETDDDELLADEVEASLDVILAERLRGEDTEADEDVEDDDEDTPNQLATVIPVRRPDEFLCQSCFLLKPPGQLADRDHQLCRDCA